MSLIFKPKISFNFGASKSSTVKNKYVPREEIKWSEAQVETLVLLRALRFTLRECGKHFDRSITACSTVIQTQNLYKAIDKKREELINRIVK